MIGGYLEILFLKQNNVCRRLQIGLTKLEIFLLHRCIIDAIS
jgi:hypothetical protein